MRESRQERAPAAFQEWETDVTDKPKADRGFDRTLAAFLRGELSAGGEGCPSPAILAALYEGALTPGERERVDQHLAGCGRCQAQSAALVRLDPEPASTLAAKASPTAAPTRRRSWGWLAAPVALAATAVLAVLSHQRTSPTPQDARDVIGAPPNAASPPERDAEADRTSPGASTAAPLLEQRAPSEDGDRGLAARPATPESAPLLAPKEERRDSAEPSTAAAMADQIIAKTSPRVVWRVRGSSIERSDDGGGTWRPQHSGTTRGLAGGSAPSAQVCWVVGAAGTVLRTTDGEHWQAASPPTDADLVAIRAADAMNATAEAANGRRFSTADGGRKWSTP